MTVISPHPTPMNRSLKGSSEDAVEMEDKIFRFLGTPSEDDGSLLILNNNHCMLSILRVTKLSLCQENYLKVSNQS